MSNGGGGGGTYAGGVYGDFELDLGQTESKLARAKAGMQDAAARMAQLELAFRAGAVGVDQLDAEMDSLIAHKAALAAQVAALEQKLRAEAAAMQQVAAQTTRVDTGMQAVHGGSSKAAMGLMQVGYALDDLQFGLGAVVNNLPQIAMSFGAGAGLGGAVAIAAVGVNQLVMHWGQLNEAIGTSPVRTEVERMHDLAAATAEATAAQDKLNEAKQREQEIAALARKRTPEQEQAAQGVQAAVVGAGGERMTGFDQVVKSMMELRSAQGLNSGGDPANKFGFWRTVKDAVMSQDPKGAMERERQRIRGEFNNENLQRAQEDVRAAKDDPGKLKALIDTIKANRNAFPNAGQLLKDLQAQTPEGKAAAEQEKIDTQERRAVRKEAIEAEKKAAKEAEAQADAEQMMRKAALKDREDVVKREEAADRKRQDREEKEYEQAAKQAPGRAKETVFGLEQATHDQMNQDVFSGKSFAEAAGRAGLDIEAKLKALGWDPDLAKEAGVGMAEDERKKMSRAAAESLYAPDKEERRKSEMYSVESAWSHIQGQIGGKDDVGQKQLEQQLLMAAALREIAVAQAQMVRRQPVAVLK